MLIKQRRFRRSNLGHTTKEWSAVISIAFMVICGIVGYIKGNVQISADFIGSLLSVVFHNIGFWIMLVVATTFGVYRKLTNPGEFMWKELPIQLGASIISIMLLYGIFFSTATDLTDTEVWNGHVTRAEYYEEWTEEVSYTDSEGKTKTRRDYHPPSWKVCTSVGDTAIESSQYASYRHRFTKETKKDIFRVNKVSIGDGDMYYVTCDEGHPMPASLPYLYVNYLRASDSIRKIQGNIMGFKDQLVTYPKVHDGDFGPIEFDRVIESGVTLPHAWTTSVDGKLDAALVTMGPGKKVNVLVYVVGTKNQQFAEALKEHWVHGKKNDVIVVLGAPEFPKVDWVQVISWTKVEEFKIELRNSILDLKSVSSPAAFVKVVTDQINKDPTQGGFLKGDMKDYEYLRGDISLPWWCQVLIILIGGTVSWFTSHYLINNDWREYGGSSRSRFGLNYR